MRLLYLINICMGIGSAIAYYSTNNADALAWSVIAAAAWLVALINYQD